MSDVEDHNAGLLQWKGEKAISPQGDIMRPYVKGLDFHWMPNKSDLKAVGFASLLEGWIPAHPIIGKDTRVLAFGSCFAMYFISWLKNQGFNKMMSGSPYIRNAFAFENVAVLAQQFRWAFDEFDSRNALWIDLDRSLFEATEERRLLLRKNFESADVLILTLGLSEVWYDRITNEPLWRAVPKEHFDPERHIFRVETVTNTIASLEKIAELRERYLPNLKIVFTVSPVRLKATFRPVSAMTANNASKAILRAALDEFLRSHWQEVNKIFFYFPSFELATEMFREPYREDNRHLYDYVPSKILSAFTQYYTDFDNDVEYKSENETMNEQQESDGVIEQLEKENVVLDTICRERLAVIKELEIAAEERLQLIKNLDKIAKDRLSVIERLDNELRLIRKK